MDSKIKEQKLREYAESVIDSPEYKEELKHLFSKLNVTKEEAIQAYLDYDMDVYAYGNEIYESISMRFVLHLHNLLKGSWHKDRQQAILDMLIKVNPESITDMGFGVPTKYVRAYVLKEKISLTLIDLYDSAFKFSEALFDYLDGSWRNFISFRKLDMNTHEYPGDFDVYLFQDSIEHVKNPQDYLKKIVNKSPKDSKYILSIPIGPKVPAHEIGWSSEEEVIKWLKDCGLKIKESKKVFINPEVDLFADQLDKEFYNIIVSCNKSQN